jgi:hypothetical protein
MECQRIRLAEAPLDAQDRFGRVLCTNTLKCCKYAEKWLNCLIQL